MVMWLNAGVGSHEDSWESAMRLDFGHLKVRYYVINILAILKSWPLQKANEQVNYMTEELLVV